MGHTPPESGIPRTALKLANRMPSGGLGTTPAATAMASLHRGGFGRLACVFILASAALVSCASHVGGGPRAYVPNERSGTISVIDVSRDVVIATWPAGRRPRGIAVSTDGRRVFVADQATSSLQVMDAASGAVEKRISLGESPEGVGMSPDGRWIAAASELSNAFC
jgi:YVTN family beta-propeller protein